MPATCLRKDPKSCPAPDSRECELDHYAVRSALRDYAAGASSLPLLRVYWYDGISQGPTPHHIALANQPDIKVRLGFVNSQGQ